MRKERGRENGREHHCPHSPQFPLGSLHSRPFHFTLPHWVACSHTSWRETKETYLTESVIVTVKTLVPWRQGENTYKLKIIIINMTRPTDFTLKIQYLDIGLAFWQPKLSLGSNKVTSIVGTRWCSFKQCACWLMHNWMNSLKTKPKDAKILLAVIIQPFVKLTSTSYWSLAEIWKLPRLLTKKNPSGNS